MRSLCYTLLFGLLLFTGCSGGSGRPGQRPAKKDRAIERSILSDKESFYYIDFERYPERDPSLPIGIFDSGTGGLTVLDALLRFDRFDNGDHSPGSDKEADFSREKFIYLADQANMPYGNYHSENKSDLLVEHVLKDVQFLLSGNYYPDPGARKPLQDKQPVKAIVIACNTATAYAKDDVEDFIEKTGTDLKVIGVIDAGATGALEVFGKDESGSIGVLATVGTVASEGYENTIGRISKELGYTGNIQVVSRGGYGMAEAVDEEPAFVDHTRAAPRENYRGPSFDHPDFRIEKALLDVYNFEYSGKEMLCDPGNTGDCQVLQINSAGNYMRYHLVSLMEKLKAVPDAQPMKALVLGCTHYPYLTDTIRQVLHELYNYRGNDGYRYRALMNKDIHVIDPAQNMAKELHAYLSEQDLFNNGSAEVGSGPGGGISRDGSISAGGSQFYISVPNTDNERVQTDSLGRFTYGYKYGRKEGQIQEYVKVVPFHKNVIPEETRKRLESSIPLVYKLIREFTVPASF